MTDRNAYASKARFLGPEMLPERPEVNPETGQRPWASGEARNRSYTGRFPGEARSRFRRASRKARRQAVRRQGRPAHAGQAAGSQEAGSPGSMQATQAGRPGRQAGQAACRPGAMQARRHAGQVPCRLGSRQARQQAGRLPERPEVVSAGFQRGQKSILLGRADVLRPAATHRRSTEVNWGQVKISANYANID